MNPALALGLLALAGLLATRLPRRAPPRSATLEALLQGGAPLVLLGLALGPGIGALDAATLAALAPLTALAVGWVGARLGARCEWRLLRRVPKETWAVVGAQALAGAGVGFLAAWLGTRLVPALATAWTPRLPAALTLGAIAIMPGARPMERAVRAAGLAPRLVRPLRRVALVDAACGTLVCAIALSLGRPPAGGLFPAWIAGLGFEVGAAVLVAALGAGLTRLAPADDSPGLALMATLLLGAGLAYATGLSPFLVCALAVAFLVNASSQRRRVRALLGTWERPTYEILLLLAGASLAVPTVWVLAAAPVLAAVRVAAQWGTARSGLAYLPGAAVPVSAGLASVAQGGSALALGLSFALARGGGGGAILTTIAVGVCLTQALAPSLLRLAPVTGPLTQAPPAPDLRPDSSPD